MSVCDTHKGILLRNPQHSEILVLVPHQLGAAQLSPLHAVTIKYLHCERNCRFEPTAGWHMESLDKFTFP
jgi:hypothetical protein